MAQAGHFIIGGFGLAGRGVAEALQRRGRAFRVVDTNPNTALQCRHTPILVGDLREEGVLREAGIEQAEAMALTFAAEEAVLQVIEVARRLRPDLPIYARVNYTSMGLKAQKLGATIIVVGEQLVAHEFVRIFSGDLSMAPVSGVP